MWQIINPTINNKTEVVAQVDREKKPVIFWDTCSLLDIIRLPIPARNHSVDSLEKLIAIKDKIVLKEIISISSELCITEFNNHIQTWISNLERESRNLTQTVNKFIEFINKANIGTIPVNSIDLSVYRLEDLLFHIAKAIIDKTIFISEDPTFTNFAHFRTTHKIPPARKKGEYKDCYIWGTCLEIRQTTADKSYQYNFLSSNVEDYADATKSDFVLEIKNEASINNINYLPNFNVAFGRLRKDGIV